MKSNDYRAPGIFKLLCFGQERFRDRLAWTEGLTGKLKLYFQNPPAQFGQGLSICLRLSESNILVLLILAGIWFAKI